ncbi:MAG: hypothetical protein AAF196_02160 [Planctomycetota bacterium]
MSRKRTAFIYVTLIVVVVVVTTVLVGRSEVTKRLVANRLNDVFDPDRLQFDDASFDLSSGVLSVENLRLETEANPDGEMRSSADLVELEIELNPLRETGSLRHVRIERANLHLDLFDGELPDFASLFPAVEGTGAPVDEIDVSRAPSLECLDSTLSLRFDPEAPPVQFESLWLRFSPVRDRPGEFGLEGNGRGPGESLTELHGGIVFQDGEMHHLELEVTLSDLGVTPDSLLPSSPPGFAENLPEGLSLDIERLRLFASYDREEELGAGWELRGLVALRDGQVGLDGLKAPIRQLNGEIGFDVLPVTSCDLDIEGSLGPATITLRGRLSDEDEFDLEAEARAVPVDEDLATLLSEVPSVAAIWNAFEPAGGKASLHTRLTRGEAGNRFEARLDLDHVSGCYRGVPDSTTGGISTPFPVPVNEVTGPILLDNGKISIDHLEMKADEGDVYFDGTINGSEVDLVFTGENIAFSERVEAALFAVGESVQTEVGEHYQRLAPSGFTDLVVIIDNDEESERFAVELEPRGASVTWSEFPVTVNDAVGRISISTDGLEIDVDATRNGASVSLEADIRSDARGGQTDIFFSATDLEIDTEVNTALQSAAPELGTTLVEHAFRGRADIELSAWCEGPVEEGEFDLRVDLDQGSLRFEDLGLAIRNLSGPVFARGASELDRADIGGVRSEIYAIGDGADDVPLANAWLQGVVGPGPSEAGDDIAAVLRNLDLNDRVRTVLDRAEIVDEELWDFIAPSGKVDMVWRRNTTIEPVTEHSIRLQLRGASVAMPVLPRPVHELVGSVTITPDSVELSELEGKVFVESGDGSNREIQVACDSGRIGPGEQPEFREIELDIRTLGFPLDENLANALEGPLGATYLSRGVRGQVDLAPLSVKFVIDSESASAIRTEGHGTVRLRDVAVDFGTPIEGFSTTIVLDEGRADSASGLLQGRIEDTALTVFGKRLSKGSGRFLLDENELALYDFDAELFDGRVRSRAPESQKPALVLGLTGSSGSLRTDLEFDRLQLGEIIGERRRATRGSEPTGDVSGILRVESFDPTNPIATLANGSIRVAEGDLGEVPLLNEYYRQFKPNRRPRFDSASLRFRLSDRVLNLSDIVLGASEIVTLRGQGAVGLDGYVDVRLTHSFFGEQNEILLVPTLFDKLMEIQVFGNLRSVQSKVLWGGVGEVERPPLGPIPPR